MGHATSRNQRPCGHDVAFHPSRIWVNDLLHFAGKVPTIPVQRLMDLSAVAAARAAAPTRPGWAAILAKAYSIVAAQMPVLRRCFLSFPWPRLFEYPESVAAVAVEREYLGEEAVFFAHVRAPDRHPLAGLHAHVRHYKETPAEDVSAYRQLIRLSRLPRWVRRWAWWYGLNVSGNRRARRFGTFGVSTYAGLGAESLHPISPLSTVVNLGVLGADGRAVVRVIYDHRIMDGATVARALARLEEVLNGAIVAELRDLGRAETTAAA